ncbi:MAG TPA: trigger factor [Gallionellaceae bacterium]
MASVESLGALERRLNASIPQQQVRGEVETRLKRLGRTAKVHGFRPGKAPFKILEQQYGPQVHQEVLGESLQRAFADAIKSQNLKVAGSPSFELKSADPAAEKVEFSATFEVYPEVKIGDLSGETMERTVFTLSDADIESTINTMRKQRSVFEPASRAAQDGDQLRLDFTGKLNGAEFEGGSAKGFSIVLGQGRMLPDFEKALIGMKAGETKSFDLTFPENYHGKDVAGKQVVFTVEVHAVEAPRLPEMDAEFVKSLGIADGDVNKLKAEVRANLEREVARRIKVRNKDSAMDALARVSQLDLPKVLVEWEAESLAQQMVQDMEQRGMRMPKGMQLPTDMFTERAQKRVKLGLILAKLVEQHQLGAKPEQVKEMIKEYAQGFNQPEQVIRWYASDPARMKEVESLVLEDNVVAWVMSAAKVVDKPVGFDELMGNG